MLKLSTKKIVAVAVSSAMILSVAGCSKTDKKDKAVISAAEEISDAFIMASSDDILAVSSEDYEDNAEMLEAALDFKNYGDLGDVYQAILDSYEYEVDKGSVDINDDEAVVDVTFTFIDYSSVAADEENLEDVDTFLDALDECEDSDEITVTYELEKNDDDEWVLSNVDEVLGDVYVFMDDPDLAFGGNLASYVQGTEWWSAGGANSNEYVNATSISCEILWDDAVYTLNSSDDGIYYTVELDGTVIKTSDVSFYNYSATLYASEVEDSVAGSLPAGSYKITWFDSEDNEITSATCTVTVEGASDVSCSTYWWFTDGDHSYENQTEIDCDLTFENGSSYPVYYTVSIDGTVVYTSETDTYSRYGYYGPDEGAQMDANGYLIPGSYTITFYDATGTELASDTATVTTTATADPQVTPNPDVNVTSDDVGFEFLNDDFRALISDVSSGGTTTGYGWWDYNNGTIGNGIYDTDDIIAFSLLLKDGAQGGDIYYAYYYSPTADFSDDILNGAPLYSATISPSSYSDGSYYDIDLNGTSANQTGYYILIVADNSNLDTVYLYGGCVVQ